LRNDIIHGKGTASIVVSAKYLISYMELLLIASRSLQTRVPDKGKGKVGTDGIRPWKKAMPGNGIDQITTQRWRPPPAGWVKINTDAAFCHSSGAASAGVVIRGAAGNVLLSAWMVLRGCASPEQAETEACLKGLRLAVEWIRKPAYLETDCSTLIQDIVKENESRSVLAGILSEIKAVGGHLPACKFTHVRRDANIVAHTCNRR
jgi:hypothetical protein